MLKIALPVHPLALPRALALAVFAACSSCSTGTVTDPGPTRASAESPGNQAASTTAATRTASRRPQAGRPDPRYRPPTGFSELEAVAGEVARATGRDIGWKLQRGSPQGPLVTIRGNLDRCTITLHPVAARKIPPNTWAFLFGHEFAHLVEELGTHSATTPANELQADIAGARYAMAAGYRVEAFLGWVLTEPNQQSQSHGSLHQRVEASATHYGIPRSVVQAEAGRASKYRAAR
jgi:hypothetical protein